MTPSPTQPSRPKSVDELRSLLRENGEAIAGLGFVLFALVTLTQAVRIWLEPWRLARRKLKAKDLPRSEEDR